jgi:hypothetical protein
MIYLHSRFYLRSSSDSFIIIIKAKATQNVLKPVVFLFWIIQNITLTEVEYFTKICSMSSLYIKWR